jgi:hypothetical protein
VTICGGFLMEREGEVGLMKGVGDSGLRAVMAGSNVESLQPGSLLWREM